MHNSLISRWWAAKVIFSVVLPAISALPSFAAPGSPPAVEAAVSARRELSLVVYQQDMALVRETRSIESRRGAFEISYPEISQQIIPGSVRPGPAAGVEILEQRYEPASLNVQSLLESCLGREIIFERTDKRTGVTESRSGTLLSLEGGRVVRFGDRVEIDPEGTLVLPGVPAELNARPRLVWLAEGKAAGRSDLAVSYLTRGLGWSCEYVLSLPESEDKAGLTGWVSLVNRTGIDYPNCRLTLVAGEVNFQSQPPSPKAMGMALAASRAPEAADIGGFSRQALSEYYRYDLGRTLSVGRFESSQIELFRAPRIKLERKYRLTGDQRYYFGRGGEPETGLHPELVLEWSNGEANYTGVPLPAGLVRIYRRSGADDFFLGEDRIGHTPRDERVSLHAGAVFDISAERRQTDYRQLSDRLREVSVEVRLKNHKDKPVTLEVDENLPGDWKITAKSQAFEKVDANTIRFSPQVPPGGESTLTYTVQFL